MGLGFAWLAGALVALFSAARLAFDKKPADANGRLVPAALFATAVWCALAASLGWQHPVSQALEGVHTLAWLAMLPILLVTGSVPKKAPFRRLLIALMLTELVRFALLASIVAGPNDLAGAAGLAQTSHLLGMLTAIGTMVLVHNLYAALPEEARRQRQWVAGALFAFWAIDLNHYAILYLSGLSAPELVVLRPLSAAAAILTVLAFRVGGDRSGGVSPSRQVAFSSVVLVMAIAYLAVLALIAEILAMFGIPSARLALITVLTLGIVGAFWALPSRRLKAQVRLFAAKHFFPHRYDYRTQWQRFVDIPAPGPQQDDLYRRALDAMVEVAECRAGALLIVEESGELVCVEERGRPELSGKRWDAAALERMRAADPVMALNPRSDDRPALSGAVPDSLGFGGEHWAFVCLRNRDKLVGAVLLSEPLVSRPLDWQDREFLLLAGRQVAAYLAEQASRDGLAEARQFDEFHRRMAFVMHDIKNLSSQMAVLSANAGKHIENPEFQADLLTTLDHSAAKLNALLNRLGRHAKESPPEPALVACDELVEGVCSEFASRTGRLVEAIIVDRLHVLACPDQLRQALTHLVQNAIDASPPDRSVTVSLSREGLNAQIEVRDQGCGMSQEFIHRKLFKPFVSTKDNGFGIGAFEARELSAAMGGRLEVQSEEGLGSRFTLVLPLSEPLVLANRREAA